MSATTAKLSTKEVKSMDSILGDIASDYKVEGITRKDAFKRLKDVKNIMRGWDTEKKVDEQENLRLGYRAVQQVMVLWWGYCRKDINLGAEVLWNIAVMLPGEEIKEKKPVTGPKPPKGKKAKALAELGNLTAKDLEKLLAGMGEK